MREATPQYLEATLLAPQRDEVLELDELWSFVGSKQQVLWVWIALCRRTRQVVAWMPGARDETTCRRLWDKVPQDYKQGRLYTDFWQAYQAVLPQEQHRACGKHQGETNHVERFNLTLRQRLGRLTRKSLSFSKKPAHHFMHLRQFFVQYNNEKAKLFLTSS